MNESVVNETASSVMSEIQFGASQSVHDMKRIWVIATVFGALWGTLEITLGAFIHNLRIPLGGMFLTAISAFLLTLIAKLYPIRGLLVRIGFIASLCKSLSPGGLIITPMIAIFIEALIAEGIYSTVGVNFFGATLTGILLPFWSFFQRVFGSIIFYGAGVFELYVKLLNKSAGIVDASPVLLVTVMLILIASFGICGSIGALLFFRLKKDEILDFGVCSLPEGTGPARERQGEESGKKRGKLFTTLFFSIMSMCFVFHFSGRFSLSLLALATLISVVYTFERQVFFKFVNPKFWTFALIVVSLSGVFLGKDFVYLGGVIPFSARGFLEGCTMLVRAATIYLLVLSFSRLFDAEDFDRFFRKIGQRHLAPALKNSFDLLPRFVSIYREEARRHRKQSLLWVFNFLASVFAAAISLINERGLKILVISGNVETGKTTSAMEIIKNLEQNGISYKAAVQPRMLDEKKTEGYRLLLMPGRMEMDLAFKNRDRDGYSFEKCAFREAKNFFRLLPRPLVYMVDEFGKLELKGKGHFQYVFSSMQTFGGLWVLTMREQYIDQFEKKLRIEFDRVLSIP